MNPVLRRLLPVALAGLAVLLFPAYGQAQSAVITCAPCTETPCTAYCATPPCPPCVGEEGDFFIFYAGNSTGTNRMYTWDVYGDNTWSGDTGTNPVYVAQLRRPHNPGTLPNGWPATVKVKSNENTSGVLATTFVSVSNVAPTAIIQGTDIGGQVRSDYVVVYANAVRQFFGGDSTDRASNSGVGTGISRHDWDPNFDGVSFNQVIANNASPWRSWTTPGLYTMRLRVTDDDTPAKVGYANLTVEVIPEGPYARIVAPASSFTEGETVRFDGNSGGSTQTVTSWKWDFDYNGETFTEQGSGQTIYHAFANARPYTVALKVSDAQNRTFLATTRVTPTNLTPVAAAQLRLGDGTVLSPPYVVDEGIPITFDGTLSHVPAPDPGQVLSWQWDFNYNGYIFLPTASSPVVTHAFPMDSDQMGAPYVVRLRVTDDDHSPQTPSEGWLNISVTVLDVPPEAQIRACTSSSYASCVAPAPPYRLSQAEPGYFRVVDISSNQDDIVTVEWDTNYTGVFTPNPAYANRQTVDITWLAISTPTLAVRITDSEGDISLATLALEIVDQPPRAMITPFGDDGLLTIPEGTVITFDASATLVVPGDQLTLLAWAWDESPGLFTPDTQPLPHNCVSGACSLADWLGCTGGAHPGNSCPQGPGQIIRTYAKGPAEEWVSLCVEDLDDTGVCIPGADPTSPATARQFARVRVVVQNVTPVIDPDDPANPLRTTLTQGDTFLWCPTVIEPGADLLSFDCNPAKLPEGMECNPSSGCLSWIPGDDAISCEEGDNPQPLSLTVCDDAGACSTFNTVLHVLNRNAPPVITGFTGAPSAPAGEPYTARLTASDPDAACGDFPSFYLCGNVRPAMSLDLNGDFTWTPAISELGAYSIGLCVRDQQGSEDCGVCHWHTLTIVDPGSLPRINAGEDVEVDPGLVCLRGEVLSNPAGHELALSWSQEAGPVFLCLLEDPEAGDAPATCLIAQNPGEYTLLLEADTGSYRVQDRVRVTVRDLPPSACVVGPRHYPIGATVELDGRCSRDPNATPLGYVWFDPYEVLESATGPLTAFLSLLGLPPGQGVASFSLTVDDGVHVSEECEVDTELLVLDEDHQVTEAAPHAVIEPALVHLVLGETVTLSAFRSDTRPPGGTLTYDWFLEDGTPLEGDGEERVVQPAETGTLRVQLVVHDGTRPSRAATATLITRPEGTPPYAANAGEDQEIALQTLCSIGVRDLAFTVLDGSASQRGSSPRADCVWTQTQGPAAGLALRDDCRAELTLTETGLHEFRLDLVVGDAVLASDHTRVAVINPGHGIRLALEAPRWDEERRLAFVDPGLTALLDASDSTHAAGRALTYHWVQRSGPAQALDDWNSPRILFTPDLPGESIGLRLWATGPNGSASLPLDLTVVALAEPNLPPVCVLAKTALSGVPGEWIDMDASGSYDPNDDPIHFFWRQRLHESDAELSIEDAEAEIARVAAPEGGVYVFEVVVSDGIERCISQPLTVTVTPNSPPLADAGEDRRICLGDAVVLDGTASHDPDGHELTYLWRIVDNGGTGMVDSDFVPDATSPTPRLTPIDSGVMRIQLVVNDGFDGGESEPDEMILTIESLCEDGDVDEDVDEDVETPDGDVDEEPEVGGDGCSCRQQSPAGPVAALLLLMGLWLLRRRRAV